MENHCPNRTSIDLRIADRLKTLRAEHSWSLAELAERSEVSRATLSRLENAEVSATALVLGKLCAVYGLTMSRLMRMVEEDFQPLVQKEAQTIWTDATIGFKRRSVSPPAKTLAGEALACELEPGAAIVYDAPPKPGLEHHLIMIEGRLEISIDGHSHELGAGDCLRYQLFGSSRFATPPDQGAHYLLFMV